jgi:transcriptional regulator GlxA family with amidase domain
VHRQLGLACAGLLDGFDCSVHWECLAAMQEASRV